MNTAKHHSTRLNPGIYIIILEFILLGGALRLYPVLRSDFPLNDGGLFFTMTQDLIENRFILPQFTSYNNESIPYGYPPLPFYLVGGIHNLFRIDLLLLFRFLPMIFSILAIPAFFLLGNELLDTTSQAIYATFAFALASPSYVWLIMGGGLTRAPAYFFSILALRSGVRLFKTHQQNDLFLTIIFIGLAGYCHLEILWTTIGFLLIAALYYSRNKAGLLSIVKVLLGVGILLSPYLIFVMFNHGLHPFIAAMVSGEFSWLKSIGKLLLDNITGEYLFSPILVLALFGLLYCLHKREFILPSWILATVILNPRSMERSLIIPIAMLVGIALTKIIIPGITHRFQRSNLELSDRESQSSSMVLRDLLPSKIGAILITYMFIRSAVTGQVYVVGLEIVLNSLNPDDRAAMQWISENTTSDSQFLVLTPPSAWEVNEVTEWFPTLAKRRSLITVQGTEWLPNNSFGHRQDLYDDAILCPLANLNCIEEVSRLYQLSFSHIYVSGSFDEYGVKYPLPIMNELMTSKNYSLLFEQDQVKIFAKKSN